MNFTLSTKTFLTIIYIVGIIGICSPFQYYFLILTPINLLLTFFFIVKAHKNLNLENIVVLTILILTTWTIEAIGVNTGEIFGAYGYGKVLGFKIFSTPPMIGINWAILVLGTGYWLKSIKIKNTLLFFPNGEKINGDNYAEGTYSPTPTIIEAAVSLYKNHTVDAITRSEP